LDLSLRMLLGGRPASAPTAWLRRLLPRHRPSAARVCADAAHMPFAEGSFDLLISNLMLHWHPSPHRLFPEFRRVLADGGLLMFSCFGPDTLRELREAFMAAWPACRPLPFVDMHDFGDMMTAAGFATPVMDVEVIRLTFPTPAALLAEAASLGGNPRDDRPAVLPGTRQARAVLAELQRRALPDGRIPLTFEIAYGHAWNDRSPRAPAGAAQSAVPLETLRGTLKRRAGG
jgi:malonyl-CoA O-methyltransferase